MKLCELSRIARRAVAPLAMAAMIVSSGSASALASGSVVFDPTNWAENLRSALSSIKIYAQEVAQTANLVRQLKHAAANSEQLLASVLFDGMSDQQRRAAMEMVGYYDDIQKLQGNLQDLQSAYDQKVHASFNAKMGVAEFMQLTRDEAKRGVKAAQMSINRDRQALERVQETYTSIAKWQMQNDASLGHQQSLQLMNTQLSALVGQNAEIISAMLDTSIKSKLSEQDARTAADKSNEDEMKRSELARQGLRDAAAIMDAQFKALGPFKVGK